MFSKLSPSMMDAVITILIITAFFLVLIYLIRLFFYIILFILSFFYKKNKQKHKESLKRAPKTEVIPYKKEEDELFRDKQLEEKKFQQEFELDGVQRIGDEFQKQVELIDDEDRIVGIAKPIGFWTALVLGDQLSQILGRASALNSRSHKGFWVSMLEAQARGLGRQKGRTH